MRATITARIRGNDGGKHPPTPTNYAMPAMYQGELVGALVTLYS